MLAHILGRLPCPKKTPRKIWRSIVSANWNPDEKCEKRVQRHQLRNEKSQFASTSNEPQIAQYQLVNCRIVSCLTKNQKGKISQNHHSPRNKRIKIRFGYTASRGVAHFSSGLSFALTLHLYFFSRNFLRARQSPQNVGGHSLGYMPNGPTVIDYRLSTTAGRNFPLDSFNLLSLRISRIALQFKLISRLVFRLRRRAIQVQPARSGPWL